MVTGWRYRILGVAGTSFMTAVSVLVANHPISQYIITTYVPLFWRLEPTILTGESLRLTILVSVLIVVSALIPLYKPRPRRILDTIFLTQRRVILAGLELATLGFFKWSHRLPRGTLVMLVIVLGVTLPAWFVAIRRSANAGNDRAVIVGDDLGQIEQILTETGIYVLGYLCPPSAYRIGGEPESETLTPIADGGLNGLERLGGLSNLDDVLVNLDIDTVVLAFRTADRGDFFGTLDTCNEHGVKAKVHRDYADDVLTPPDQVGTLVDVDIEPWDLQDYVFKRLFDVTFAWVGLVVLSPVIIVISVAIKLDSSGPLLYQQERTSDFGETFTVYKFRTMNPEGESVLPVSDEDNNRITRFGRVLRKTHLDEIPQLWSIFIGQMSVVGPRAAWTEEEQILEHETNAWRKRWFVKPGLTGLAQVNDAKSTNPEEKLRYDLRYIREQSLWLDLKIVIRQVYKVLRDGISVVLGNYTKEKRE